MKESNEEMIASNEYCKNHTWVKIRTRKIVRKTGVTYVKMYKCFKCGRWLQKTIEEIDAIMDIDLKL